MQMLYYAHFSRESREEMQSAVFSETFSTELHSSLSPAVVSELSQPFSCRALTAMALNFARFVRDMEPTYIAAVFDSSRKTFRSEKLPSYKQQRPSVSSWNLVSSFSIS